MHSKILFDTETIDPTLVTGWGFSCLVDDHILFDTGEKEAYLLHNIKRMNIDIATIEAVVISHEHWDHSEGLWGILKRKEGIRVYVCPHFGKAFKERIIQAGGVVVEVDTFTEITEAIFLTGEIVGAYKGECLPEQALMVKTNEGISVMTGCSHPGIIKILENIKNQFPHDAFYFVFGGFHLKGSSETEIENIVTRFKELQVKKVGPTHCSGESAVDIFKKFYGTNYCSIKTGKMFEL